MNLIEQLGGYEAAKEWYKDQDLRGNHTVKIRAALLEYRRQHNIFEIGDLITHPMFWGLFRVKEKMNHHVFGVTKTGYESKLATQLIRHATDAEIAAGHRL